MNYRSAFAVLLVTASLGIAATRINPNKAKANKPAAQPMDRMPAAERQPAQKWMRGMSLHDMVAQLVIVTSYGENPGARSELFRKYVHQVRDLRVGGMIVANRVQGGRVINAEPVAMAAFLNRMQKLARVPLLIGADFERGASMRVADTPKFPYQMAYGAARDLNLTRYLGLATARESRALGVHWVFAPDADVNNNPDNPIINIRSFGENPQDVAEQVKAFIEGAHSDARNRVLVTAKHFPGHGDTSVDSHINLAVVSADRARMDRVELFPFRAAIAQGVDAVMTAHLSVPAIEPQEMPATVSSAVLTGLLRNELGFNGLVVTDAMDMAGLSKFFPAGEAAVRSIEAGADVLLMPPNPEEAIRAVVNAVNSGRISRKRIEQSTMKVLAAKARVGLHRNRLVNLEEVSDAIDPPESHEKAQQAADKAVTLVKNEGNAVPLMNPEKACIFVLSESRYGQQGRKLMEEVQKRGKNIRAVLLDPLMATSELDSVRQKAAGCEQNVVAAFVTVGAFRGNVALAGNLGSFVTNLLEEKTPVTLISLGNPYLLRSYPKVAAYMATFSTTTTSEIAAVKAIMGETQIGGRLPVTIPGIANYGDGILLAASRH